MNIEYKKKRLPNTAYRTLLRFVQHNGWKSASAHDERSWMYFAPPDLRINIREDGVPLITERDYRSIYKNSINELFAFINGVRTLEGLREFGVSDRFWAPWVTKEKCEKRGLPEGDLGDGSYGAVFHDFPTPEGPFNQIAAIVQQIKDRPYDRSHRISNWYLPYLVRLDGQQQRTVVTPCHGDMYFRVFNGNLNLYMTQHKADIVTGVPSNMIQYAAFLIAMAHVTGYKVGELIIKLVDAHFYLIEKREGIITPVEAIYQMLERKAKPFPTLQLAAGAPKDIFMIRAHHFILDEYDPHPSIKGIETAI